MTELAHLKFYATQPHPCSYLDDEQATTLFLDPSQPMTERSAAKIRVLRGSGPTWSLFWA